MIESLKYVPKAENVMPWADKIDYFKANPITTFKPGLNIVFGANGSGKSTLLKLMGLHLAAVQGGQSVVTQSWISDVFGFSSSEVKLPCDVVHDGQPIMYHDARTVVGLFAGAAFDDDFFNLGVEACMAKGSVGQLSMHHVTRLLNVLVAENLGRGFAAGFPKEVEWRYPRTSTEKSVAARIAAVETLMAARCAKGPLTLLLDEPESGFSMPWQAAIWRNILAKVDPEKFQVIVATHSPFALGIKGAHYVEMTPEYTFQCISALLGDLGDKMPGLLKLAAEASSNPAPARPAPAPVEEPPKKARRPRKPAAKKEDS